jgi:hypothetical protein
MSIAFKIIYNLHYEICNNKIIDVYRIGSYNLTIDHVMLKLLFLVKLKNLLVLEPPWMI